MQTPMITLGLGPKSNRAGSKLVYAKSKSFSKVLNKDMNNISNPRDTIIGSLRLSLVTQLIHTYICSSRLSYLNIYFNTSTSWHYRCNVLIFLRQDIFHILRKHHHTFRQSGFLKVKLFHTDTLHLSQTFNMLLFTPHDCLCYICYLHFYSVLLTAFQLKMTGGMAI